MFPGRVHVETVAHNLRHSFSSNLLEKAADFDANINAICKITFNIGGYFGGYRSYIVELSEELKAYTKLWEDEEPLLLLDDNEEPFTKNSYIAALKELHIGEWRRRYTAKRFGYMVLDGMLMST